MEGERINVLKIFPIFVTLACELYFSTVISIVFDRFVFSWSKTLVGFIPGNFATTLMHEALRASKIQKTFWKISITKDKTAIFNVRF